MMRISTVPIGVMLLTMAMAAMAYGPFDYTNPEHVREKLPVVERYHFNKDVENLTGTMPGASIGAHLWYVIKAFPNHHRALNSMALLWRQSLQSGKAPDGAPPDKTPEHLFERAIQFAPHDGAVRLLYGIYLHKAKRLDDALRLYKQAEKLLPQSAEVHYNLGLLYVDKNDYDLALSHAREAYRLGFPLLGLKQKLIAAGAWR